MSRPACWVKDLLIFNGEEKSNEVDFDVVVEELKTKFYRLDPLLFESVQFMICYAAAGWKLRFYAIDGSVKKHRTLSPADEYS